MKRIKLTQEKFALVDDADFDLLKQWKWCAVFDKHTSSYYAVSNRHRWEKEKPIVIKMSRIIMGAVKGEVVDHINHNTLDNRKSNLRKCSHAENQRNRKENKRSATGYKGVSVCTGLTRYYKKPMFQAQIRVSGKLITLAYGEDTKKLAKVYNQSAKKHFGDFAYLNVVK